MSFPQIKLVDEECERCETELTEEIVPHFVCSTRVAAECGDGGGGGEGRWTERCERGKEPRKPRGHDEMLVRGWVIRGRP